MKLETVEILINENSFLKTFRNAGFAWVNKQDSLKKRIIKHASGLSGVRPKIVSSFLEMAHYLH